MSVFFILLGKIIPLYGLILLGFIAGRLLKVRKESVASLLIYMLSPLVIFHGVVTTKLDAAAISLPLLFACLCFGMCGIAYAVGKSAWRDSTKNIFAYTGATGNTGYFGIPVALALFSEKSLGLMALSILGFVLFENSLGFFVTARGSHTAKDSLRKVMMLPSIYAFALGVIANLCSFPQTETYMAFALNIRGAFSVLGMMLIGLGLSDIHEWKLDLKFFSLSFLFKFVLWPCIIAVVLWIDITWLHFYDDLTHQIMILLSVVPLAANTVALATELKAQPEKASMAVLASTLFALVYIPLVAVLFL